MKKALAGEWHGEGFSKYPTIDSTSYDEIWIFKPDDYKPCIHFDQKTWYKNDTDQNGQTVFWDTGFILLKENEILLISSQAGGRQETYRLTNHAALTYTFESISFANDPRMVKSQRILTISTQTLSYELNMETRENRKFENHLRAELKRVEI